MNDRDHTYLMNANDEADYNDRLTALAMEKKDAIAVAMTVEAHLFDSVDFDRVFNPTTLAYRGLAKTVQILCMAYSEVPKNDSHQMHIGGQDSEVAHHDIDSALNIAFGADVMTDSESGMFVATFNEEMQDVVETFLVDNFPTLKFKTYDLRRDNFNDPKPRGLTNWPMAKDYCKRHKLMDAVQSILSSLGELPSEEAS